MTRILVDFNDREVGGTVPSLVGRGDASLELFERVLAFDSEGNECMARVVEIEGEFLSLTMDWETFETALGAAPPEVEPHEPLIVLARRNLVES